MDKKTEKGSIEGSSKNSKAQLVIVFLIGFLLGLLVGPTFMGERAEAPEVSDENAMEETMDENNEGDSMESEKTVEPGTNTVEAHNQLPGDRVVIDKVMFADVGWAVVHESIEGMPANALGAQRFDAGEHTNASVELLRGTELGNTYFVILYEDNGDGEFSLKEDMPLQETGGNTISTTFETIQVDRKN